MNLFQVGIGSGATLVLDLGPGFEEIDRIFSSRTMEELRVAIETGAFQGSHLLKNEIQRLYREGAAGHKPLHRFTIQQKGNSHPLVASGSMANAVRVTTESAGGDRTNFNVGIPPGRLALRAMVQEGGQTVRVTPAMRAYLASRGFALRATTRHLTIPARPVFAPALQTTLPKIQDAIMRQVQNTVFGQRFAH